MKFLRKQSLQRLLPLYGVIVTTLIVVGLESVLLPLARDIVDAATGPFDGGIPACLLPSLTPLQAIISIFSAITLVRSIAQTGRRFFSSKLSIDVQHDLRLNILRSLQNLDGPVRDRVSTGRVASRLISDLQAVSGLLAMLPSTPGSVIKLFIVTNIMLVLPLPLTLVGFTVVSTIVCIVVNSHDKLHTTTWIVQQQADETAGQVKETVSGIRAVKVFARVDNEIAKIERSSSLLHSLRPQTARLSARFQPALQPLPQLSFVGNIVVGGWLTISGYITLGTLVTLATHLIGLTALSCPVSSVVISIQLTSTSIDRTSDVIDARPDNPEPAGALPLPDGPVGISFSHVTHSRGGRTLIGDVPSSVVPGATLALIDPPGSEETIATELLDRHYPPDSRTVTIDAPSHGTSTDTARVLSSDAYDAITVVPGTPCLFAGTLYENITLANPEASQEEITAVATVTQVNFVDDLPQGQDTTVGECGCNLSDEQAQHIALARVFLARPQVLALDDVTSAIDAAIELEILSALTLQLADTTIVVVAHRSSILEQADDITIFEDGAITGIGTRAELITSHPRLTELMDINQSVCPEVENLVLDPIDSEDPGPEELWPDEFVPTSDDLTLDTVSRRLGGATSQMNRGIGRAGGDPGGPGGPSGRGGGCGDMGAALANAPVTPELLERVWNLPPAVEKPRVSAAAPDNSKSFSLRRLFSYIRGLFISVIALLALVTVADLASSVLVRYATDHGISVHDEVALWACAAGGLATVFISWTVVAISAAITACIGERLPYALRIRYYRHLQLLGINYFEANRSDTTMTRMTTDIDALSSFLRTGLIQGTIAASTLLGVTAPLLATQVPFTVAALASFPTTVVTILIFCRISSRLYKSACEQFSLINADFQGTIGRFHEIQMYHRVADAESSFAEGFDKYRAIR